MTPSEKINRAVFEEIQHAGRTLIDPKELFKWCSDRGIRGGPLSAATGASVDDCQAKLRAASDDRILEPGEYARLSKPLTQANYPGDQGTWEYDQPTNYLFERTKQALDAMPPDYWRELYLEHTGREPDVPGVAWWKNMTEALFVQGIEK